jgi:hypothetical protein
MSASWLQFAGAIVLMYLVVVTAGLWAKRRRAQLGRDEHH